MKLKMVLTEGGRLKTLFNIVEERLKQLLNFDVSAVYYNDVQKGQ